MESWENQISVIEQRVAESQKRFETISNAISLDEIDTITTYEGDNNGVLEQLASIIYTCMLREFVRFGFLCERRMRTFRIGLRSCSPSFC